MTTSEETAGTQAAVIGTEHQLYTTSGAGTRLLRVDLNNLAAGDIIELRVKLRGKAGGTERTWRMATFAGPVGEEKIVDALPAPMPAGGTFTLKQTAGVGRSFDWSVVLL